MNAEKETNTNNNNIICYTCEKPGHKQYQCPLNKTAHKTAAMVQMNHDDYSENQSYTRPHECDEAQAEGQIKLACVYVTSSCGRP